MHRFLPLARRFRPALCAAAIVALLATAASACPTCANGMAGADPQHQNLIDGYFYSILFMMSMPFLLIGSFSGYMYWEVRKARARAEEAPDHNDVESSAGQDA